MVPVSYRRLLNADENNYRHVKAWFSIYEILGKLIARSWRWDVVVGMGCEKDCMKRMLFCMSINHFVTIDLTYENRSARACQLNNILSFPYNVHVRHRTPYVIA